MRLNWQHWHKALSPEECERITKLCRETAAFQSATVFKNNEYVPSNDIRETKVAWVKDPQLRQTCNDYFLEANRNAFNFIVDFLPDIQFAEYEKGCFYTWHHDINWDSSSLYDRKLSIIIQLSDPSTYEGGNFEFKELEQPQGFRDQGSVLVFPSYNVHRVTEVTEGVRNSIVCWMEGPRWR